MPYKDPEKQRAAQKKHYLANRDVMIARAVRANARLREKTRLHTRKAKDVPCADCGQRYPYYVMQFDHVRGTKEFNIGSSIAYRKSLRRLQAEIDKCEVVCANCHMERTHGPKS